MGAAPGGGEGIAPGGMMANIPCGVHGGATHEGDPLGAVNTAEKDAELVTGEIWPAYQTGNSCQATWNVSEHQEMSRKSGYEAHIKQQQPGRGF